MACDRIKQAIEAIGSCTCDGCQAERAVLGIEPLHDNVERELIRPTDIEPLPAPAVTARRATRIEIDECATCLFFEHIDDRRGCGEICNAPTLDDPCGWRAVYEDDLPLASWCPLRGLVLLIGGPRAQR